MADVREFPLRVLFEKAPDVEGCWDATILELDASTIGTSLVNAMEMAADMAEQLILDDLNNNREPMRNPEPDAAARWGRILQRGSLVADHDAFVAMAKRANCMIAMLTIRAERRERPTHSDVRPIATDNSSTFAHC